MPTPTEKYSDVCDLDWSLMARGHDRSFDNTRVPRHLQAVAVVAVDNFKELLGRAGLFVEDEKAAFVERLALTFDAVEKLVDRAGTGRGERSQHGIGMTVDANEHKWSIGSGSGP